MNDDKNLPGPTTPEPDDRRVAASGPGTERDTAPHMIMGPDPAAPGGASPGAPAGAPGARSPDPEAPRPDFVGPHVSGGPHQPVTGPALPPGPQPGTQPGDVGGAGMPPAGAPPYGGGGAYGEPPYATGPIPPQRARNNRWLRWTVAGVGALVLFVGAGAGGAAVALHYSGDTTLPAVQPAQGTSNTTSGDSVAAVAKKVLPSVVAITVPVSNGEVQGSGVILKSDGTILTNNHVVADAANGGKIIVEFSNGKKASASIVGRDPSSDLAVIKAKGVSGLTPATFADSGSVKVGDSVIAIGSPLGLNGSVTSGIVSALNRSVTLSENEGQDQNSPFQNPFGQGQNSSAQQPASTVVSAIQTDAAINPGNSGGPLLNSAGQVIGINTAIESANGTSSGEAGNIGLGFAIPSTQAHDVAQQLISKGKAMHAYLGVSVTDTVSSSGSGAVVAAVESGSPAAKAGLKKGDVITKVDGKTVSDSGSLVAYIRDKKSGDEVTLTYTRNGTTHTTDATLSEKAG